MRRSFYLIFLSVLLSFSFSNDGFAAAELRQSTEVLTSKKAANQKKKIKKKRPAIFQKIAKKVKKLKEKKAWFLIGLAILSALLFTLVGLVLTLGEYWLFLLLFPIGTTIICISTYFTANNNNWRNPKLWLILPIVINLGLALFGGFVLWQIIQAGP